MKMDLEIKNERPEVVALSGQILLNTNSALSLLGNLRFGIMTKPKGRSYYEVGIRRGELKIQLTNVKAKSRYPDPQIRTELDFESTRGHAFSESAGLSSKIGFDNKGPKGAIKSDLKTSASQTASETIKTTKVLVYSYGEDISPCWKFETCHAQKGLAGKCPIQLKLSTDASKENADIILSFENTFVDWFINIIPDPDSKPPPWRKILAKYYLKKEKGKLLSEHFISPVSHANVAIAIGGTR